jgi:hypothetical protein
MSIQVLTHLGHAVATRFAMCESLGRPVYIHLVLDVSWSRDVKRYVYRTRG